MKADTITKDYISDTNVFADVFNYFIYGGEQVITPEQLEERDPTEIALPYGADGAVVPVQKFRDAQKQCIVMTDGKLEYVIYGTEAQAKIHNAMTVRNNLYDALEYAGQVAEAAKSHRKELKKEKERKLGQGEEISNEGKKSLTSDEFLSGFWEDDRLIPSVTVTIYFGPDEWTGPMSLFDMIEVKDPRILACMDNYHLRLIAPAQMPDEELMKFQSSLREVLLFIKYSKNPENLNRVLKDHEKRFREMERRAVDVIEVITNTGLKYEEREEKIDVCEAIKEIRMEERRIGELKKAQESARNFYNLGVDIETIAKGVGYTVDVVKGWIGLLPDV